MEEDAKEDAKKLIQELAEQFRGIKSDIPLLCDEFKNLCHIQQGLPLLFKEYMTIKDIEDQNLASNKHIDNVISKEWLDKIQCAMDKSIDDPSFYMSESDVLMMDICTKLCEVIATFTSALRIKNDIINSIIENKQQELKNNGNSTK